MGYTTDFSGSFRTNKPVTDEFRDYINKFSHTRRMMRDVAVIKEMDPNWADHCLNGNLGTDGEYYLIPDIVDKSWLHEKSWDRPNKDGNFVANFGQVHDRSVLNYNCPPSTQPGLWCQWYMPDNETVEWDGGEKFYNYVEWLEYFIDHFFKPAGYTLNGTVQWRGEDFDDIGTIIIQDNVVHVAEGVTIEDDGSLISKDILKRAFKEYIILERGNLGDQHVEDTLKTACFNSDINFHDLWEELFR